MCFLLVIYIYIYICYIARYMDVWNDIGNPKYMTFAKLVQVWNFITFELKVIWHEERATQSFYADCFYIVSSQPNQRAVPVALPRSEPQLSHSEAGTQLSAFSQIPKIMHDVIHTPWSQFLTGFLFCHLWMTPPPRMRDHQH